MEEKLVEILTMLENDLKDIDTAVKHIARAEDAAVAVIDSNDKFINATKENLHELEKGIKTVVKELTEDTDTLVIKWEELNEKHLALTDRLAKLTTYFESVNFPARLDKIDTSISAVNQGIQANQNLLNDLYRRMDQHAEKQSEKFNLLSKQSTQLRTFSILITVLVIAGLVIGLINIFI